MRKRSWTIKQLKYAVKNSISIRQVLIALNLVPAGGNYKQINKYIKENNLNTNHFLGKAYLRGQSHNWSTKIQMKKILVKNSAFTSSFHLKNRLIQEGYFKPICSCCGLDSWLGEPMRLELDHINGINTDHRLSNLRLLCPNCHSLTPTYRGKNKQRKR